MTESFILIAAAYAFVAAIPSPHTLLSVDLCALSLCFGIQAVANVPCGHNDDSMGLNSEIHHKKQP